MLYMHSNEVVFKDDNVYQNIALLNGMDVYEYALVFIQMLLQTRL